MLVLAVAVGELLVAQQAVAELEDQAVKQLLLTATQLPVMDQVQHMAQLRKETT
jgi:CheY-like chemotaxis protein